MYTPTSCHLPTLTVVLRRSDIVANRKFAYGCLFTLIMRVQWHPGYGPFFHYFAHLYHATCQPTRGKDDLISSIQQAADRGLRGRRVEQLAVEEAAVEKAAVETAEPPAKKRRTIVQDVPDESDDEIGELI